MLNSQSMFYLNSVPFQVNSVPHSVPLYQQRFPHSDRWRINNSWLSDERQIRRIAAGPNRDKQRRLFAKLAGFITAEPATFAAVRPTAAHNRPTATAIPLGWRWWSTSTASS